MTKEQWALLVKVLKSAYPQYTNFLADQYSLELWYRALKDIPYEALNLAVQQQIMVSKYPPSIAELRASVSPKSIDWSEAWEEVKRAIRLHGSYNETKALDSMSETTREAVKRMGFKEICFSENEAVDRANFRMIYEQIAKRKEETAQLPEGLQARLNGVLQIGAKNEKDDLE